MQSCWGVVVARHPPPSGRTRGTTLKKAGKQRNVAARYDHAARLYTRVDSEMLVTRGRSRTERQ